MTEQRKKKQGQQQGQQLGQQLGQQQETQIQKLNKYKLLMADLKDRFQRTLRDEMNRKMLLGQHYQSRATSPDIEDLLRDDLSTGKRDEYYHESLEDRVNQLEKNFNSFKISVNGRLSRLEDMLGI